MKITILTLSFLLLSGTAFADRITFRDGTTKPLTGSIVTIDADKVTITVRSVQRDIAANTIASTEFDGEPGILKLARTDFLAGRMEEVLERLAKVDAKTLSTLFLKQEAHFLRAAAKGKLALEGKGDTGDAEKELMAFIGNHKTSYHLFDIGELWGELALWQEDFVHAREAFTMLGDAPWHKHRAKWTLGMIDLRENNVVSAKDHFGSVLHAEEALSGRLRAQAKGGLALCLAAEKKFDEAVTELAQIADAADNEDSIFSAFVYNSLGATCEKAGKPGEAILAYLHTDILFSAAKEEHVKALTALSKLWREVSRPERAEEVEKKLDELYNIAP